MAKRLALAVSIAAVLAPGNVSGQDRSRTVEQFTCKEVMREQGSDRDVAIAFLHGFFLGKSASSKFDLDVLHKQSDAFIERCLDNPAERAIDAMARVKG
jgi:hypothetical protein